MEPARRVVKLWGRSAVGRGAEKGDRHPAADSGDQEPGRSRPGASPLFPLHRAARTGTGLIVMAALLAGGCSRSENAPAAGGDAAAVPSPRPPESRGPAVSEDEAKALGASFEKAIEEGNLAQAQALIDWDALLDATCAGIEAPKATSDGFRSGLKESMNKPNNFVPQLIAQVKQGADFRFLKVRSREKRRTALFRMAQKEGGVNFLEFVLGRGPQGTPKIVDIYNYLAGELTSLTLRRLYIPVAAQASRGIVARLTGSDQLLVTHQNEFLQFVNQVNQGKAAEAMATYRKLPTPLQNDKSFLLLRMRAAQALGDQEYASFFEDFRKLYPNDPSIDLLSIDYDVSKKQYDKVLASLDRLEKAVDGDANLKVMRANLHIETENYPAASKDLDAAIEQEPTYKDAYWTKVAVTMHEKKFDETVKTLNLLRDRFHLTFGDLTKIPLYAEFAKSPEYRAWHDAQQPTEKSTKAAAKTKKSAKAAAETK